MKDKVLEFIKLFDKQDVIDVFSNGCCYWFARILKERFYKEYDSDPIIMYDPLINHFGTEIDDKVYDVTGDVTDKYNWVNAVEYLNEDEILAERIVRDCIDIV